MKRLLWILSAVCALSLCGAALSARAAEIPAAETTAFLPASDEQYMNLSAPLDVWWDEEALVISDSGRIVLYTDGTFRATEGRDTIKGVARKGNYIVWQENNALRYVDFSQQDSPVSELRTSEGVLSCAAFALSGDQLACSLSDGKIRFYVLSETAEGLSAERNSARGDIEITGNIALGFAEDGTLYYSAANMVYRKQADGGVIGKPVSGNVQRLAAKGDAVYYTTGESLHKLDFGAEGGSPVDYDVMSDTPTLRGLVAPYGIAVKGENLLIADRDNNAVLEFDPNAEGGKGAFTGYAVATSGDSAGRLSASAADAAMDEKAIYLADTGNNRLQICEATGEITVLPLPFSPEVVAAGGDTLFAAGRDDGNRPALALIDRKDFTVRTVDADVKTPVLSAAYSEGNYYFATQATTVSGALHRLREADGTTKELQNDINVRPAALAADVGGNIYFCHTDQSGHAEVLVRTKEQWDNVRGGFSFSLATVPVKIQADFEGNLFALESNGAVRRYDRTEVADGYEYAENETGKRALTLGANLASQFESAPEVRSFAFSFAREEAVILYRGGLCATTAGLDVATPLDIPVPTDLALLPANEPLAGDGEFSVMRIPAGKNLYLFDLPALAENAGCFPYRSYLRLTADINVVVADETEGYAVVLFADDSDLRLSAALVDLSDLEPSDGYRETAPAYAEGRTVTRVNAFKYPLLSEFFSVTAEQNGLPKGTAVTLIQEIEIENYSLPGSGNAAAFRCYLAALEGESGEYTAYIPADMIAQALAETGESVTYREKEIQPGKSGVIEVFEDAALTRKTDTLAQKTSVCVYEEKEGVARISYQKDGERKEGYISADYVANRGRRTPVIVAAIVLLALSLAATAVYFLTRRKSREEEPPPDAE